MRKTLVIGFLWGAALVGCGGSSTTGNGGGNVIGMTSVNIDTRTTVTRTGEAAIGDWMADSFKDAITAMGHQVDVAVINAGGIRGGALDPTTNTFLTPEGKIGKLYPAGPLTDQDVAGWYPFQNDHTVLTITGTQLKSTLERAVSQLPADLLNDKGGPLMQIAGGSYTVDCSGTVQQLDSTGKMIMTEGTRIVKIQVGSQVIYDTAANVDQLASTTLNLAVNSFIAAGNNGSLALTQGTVVAQIPYAQWSFATALQDRVKASTPISPSTSGRITIIGTCNVPVSTP
jgi:2',3'-cyclic-nucleotide 2'-phosphodiesterase (5'-nucleotidase family)